MTISGTAGATFPDSTTQTTALPAPSTSGNVLTSNGTTWTSSANGPGASGTRGQTYTGNNTFTIPSGVTAVKVTVVGGGGGASSTGPSGGGGGAAISYLTGLTPGATLSVTVGGAGSAGNSATNGGTGGTSQVSSGTQTISTISATGGAGAVAATFNTVTLGGIGSGGTLNIRGGAGSPALLIGCVGVYPGPGGSTILGGGATPSSPTGAAYGGGGSHTGTNTVGAGTSGVVIFEW